MKKIFAIILFFIFIGSVHATEFYRGDNRNPVDVKKAGGFYPNTFSEGAPTRQISLSLYNYVHDAAENGGFVSTSIDLAAAANFVQPGGYIYSIQGDRNFLDVNTILGEYGFNPREREYTALGGIPWGQVRGWRIRIDGSPFIGPFIQNPDYVGDDSFAGDANRNLDEIIPMAGFPRGHPALTQLPWSQYPFPGCGSGKLDVASKDSKSASDQCDISERFYEWQYLAKYRSKSAKIKSVINKGTVTSYDAKFPNQNNTWLDMDGLGYLSLCGLKNDGNNVFKTIVKDYNGDFGWAAGRAFVVQNGRAAYCRFVYINTHIACTDSEGIDYFNKEIVGSLYMDAGYEDSRSWPSVFSDGTTPVCRITGTSISGFYMNCNSVTGKSERNTFFYLADPGWPDSRIWMDIKGSGPGRDSFCRLIGGIAANIKLQCTLRLNNNNWSADITSPKIDGGYVGFRYPIKMNGSRQEYCRVTGGYYDYLTCTKLTDDNVFVNYAILLPVKINPSNKAWVSFADIDGDGRDDMCVMDKSASKVNCYTNKGGFFNAKAVTLQLGGIPVGDFIGGTSKIMPIAYTEAGPVVSVCYNDGGNGRVRCDKFTVY